jgi:hypothetical protein
MASSGCDGHSRCNQDENAAQEECDDSKPSPIDKSLRARPSPNQHDMHHLPRQNTDQQQQGAKTEDKEEKLG